MSALLVLVASALLAAAAGLPADRARRSPGPAAGAITLNIALLVVATVAASALGLLSSTTAVVALTAGYVVGSTAVDRVATRLWGPPVRRI